MARLTNTDNVKLPDDIHDNVEMFIMVDKDTIAANKSLLMDVVSVKNGDEAIFNICIRRRIRGNLLPTADDYVRYFGYNQKDACDDCRTTTVFASFKADNIQPVDSDGKFSGFTLGGILYKQVFAFSDTPMVSDNVFRFVCDNMLHGKYKVFSMGKDSYIEITEIYEGAC